MRALSTRLHGISDYITGFLLMASPWLFDFYMGGAETLVPVLAGLFLIGYGACTQYEAGILGPGKGINLQVHFNLDILTAIVLGFSPWIFDFGELVFLPHFAMGMLIALLSIITDRITAAQYREYAEKHKLYYLTD
ncbi:MAG: SPW repeat domain-containing protein [Bacteroidia bacterium]